jgi:GTP-binding protein HflX
VGFIRKLPHHLVESFKSTLDEVREADLLLHVVDLAHPFHDNQIDVVTKTLHEIGAADIPTILVLNKIDLYRTQKQEIDLEAMRGYYRELGYDKVVFVSATANENITGLKQMIFEEVKRKHIQLYPNFLKEQGFEFSPWPTE